MQGSFYILYPLAFTFPLPQALTPPLPYPYPLYSYTELSPLDTHTHSQEIDAEAAQYQAVLIKQEELSSKPQSELPRKRPSRFRYPKKNVESNVVNQCYSFLTTRSKSFPIISKLLGSKQRINSFYQIMKQGRKKQTKYMGRSVLQQLILLEEDHPVYILHRKLRCSVTLKISELRQAIKVAINYFLKKIIVCAILTSSKLDRTTVRQHLSRSREIVEFLNRNSTSG